MPARGRTGLSRRSNVTVGRSEPNSIFPEGSRKIRGSTSDSASDAVGNVPKLW